MNLKRPLGKSKLPGRQDFEPRLKPNVTDTEPIEDITVASVPAASSLLQHLSKDFLK